jgi:predicted RNA-binding protein YlxR (DUF448 family)
MVNRKMPQRQCLGCMEMKPKKELIRMVKDKDGIISLDLTGKKNGRGAYLCHSAECFVKARKARRFERAFSCQIDETLYDMMEKELRDEQ